MVLGMLFLIIMQKKKFDLYYSLFLEKTYIFYNVIVHIKSVWNKDQNHYYYNIFLEKCSYQLPNKMILNKFLYKL